MTPQPTELKTPLLLLAMPQIHDPFFRHSVVLLVHHDAVEGSLGFIVNRPTELKLKDILEDLEIPWASEQSPPAFFGGPVRPEVGTLLFLDRDDGQEGDSDGDGLGEQPDRQICPGVSASQNVSDLETLESRPGDSFRLYLGYAGWGEGQLEQEILRNDWLIAPVLNDLIFSGTPDEAWRKALASVGVNPDQLPMWTPQSGSEPAAN
jgi:putative transcriptional regulator